MAAFPSIEVFSAYSTDEKYRILELLFEPCATLNTLVADNIFKENSTFRSYQELIEEIRAILLSISKSSSAEDPRIGQIIAAHPRLGAKKVDSKLSQVEQLSLKSSNSDEEIELSRLNDLYESKFPGLRYVVYVNGRPRKTIMQNMRERIARNDLELEKIEAMNAMCDIALDRMGKLSTAESI